MLDSKMTNVKIRYVDETTTVEYRVYFIKSFFVNNLKTLVCFLSGSSFFSNHGVMNSSRRAIATKTSTKPVHELDKATVTPAKAQPHCFVTTFADLRGTKKHRQSKAIIDSEMYAIMKNTAT